MSNIYKIVDENDLDSFLNNHKKNIVLIMFTSPTTCKPCKKIKPKFLALRKEHPDVFFLYIDIQEFNDITGKYTKNAPGIPTFMYYYDHHNLAEFTGADEYELVNTLLYLKEKLVNIEKELDYAKNKQINSNKDLITFDYSENMETNISTAENISNGSKIDNSVDLNNNQNINEIQEKNDLLDLKYSPENNNTGNNMNNNISNNMTDKNNTDHIPIINEIKEEYKESHKEENEDIIFKKKLDMMVKLHELQKRGFKVKSFSMDSKLEEMILEYETQIRNMNKTPEEIREEKRLEKKKEKIRKICELNNIQKQAYMRELLKIEQIEKLQKMKEDSERNNNNNN